MQCVDCKPYVPATKTKTMYVTKRHGEEDETGGGQSIGRKRRHQKRSKENEIQMASFGK